MVGEFDFGVILEIGSLVFLISSKNYMKKYDQANAKSYIICAMMLVG